MDTLTLTCTPTGWLASYAGPWSQSWREAFGADTVHLDGFDATTPSDEVLAAMTSVTPARVAISVQA